MLLGVFNTPYKRQTNFLFLVIFPSLSSCIFFLQSLGPPSCSPCSTYLVDLVSQADFCSCNLNISKFAQIIAERLRILKFYLLLFRSIVYKKYKMKT